MEQLAQLVMDRSSDSTEIPRDVEQIVRSKFYEFPNCFLKIHVEKDRENYLMLWYASNTLNRSLSGFSDWHAYRKGDDLTYYLRFQIDDF